MMLVRCLVCIILLCSQALAWMHGKPPLHSSPLGTNLVEVVTGSPERPFLNLFKEGGGWATAKAGNLDTGEENALYASCLDANHYLTISIATCNSNTSTTFTFLVVFVNNSVSHTPPYPAGNYVMLWDGNGASPTTLFQFNMSGNSDAPTVTSCPISGAPNRLLLGYSSPSGRQEIDQTGISSGGSGYPTNIRFVYSPDSTCGAAGTREALLATAPICTAVGTNTAGIFDPVFLGIMAPFSPIRFMKWSQIDSGNPLSNWSDRSTPCWAFWNEGSSGVRPATTTNNVDSGVPFEIQFALANALSADIWLNLPFLLTPSAMTSLATLEHSNLNANLKTYIEAGNEWWNVTSAEVGSGVFAAAGVLGDAAFPCAGNAAATDPCPSPNPGSSFQKWFDFGALQGVRAAQAWKAAWGTTDYNNRVFPMLGGNIGDTAKIQTWMDFQDTFWGGAVCSGCSGNTWTGIAATQVRAGTVAPYFPIGTQCPRAWTANVDGGVAQCVLQTTNGGQIETGIGAPTATHTTSSANACSVATGLSANHYSVSSGHSYGSLVNGKPVQLKFDVNLIGPCDDLIVDGLTTALLQNDQSAIIVDNTGAGFPANISGTVLTVTNASVNMSTCCGPEVKIGGTVNGSGTSANTFITGDSTSGATACGGSPCTGMGYSGTYRVNNSQTVTCNPCTVGYPAINSKVAGASCCDTTNPWIGVFTNATSIGSMTASWRLQCPGINCDDYAGGWIKQVYDFLGTSISLVTGAPYNLVFMAYEGGQTFDAQTQGDELNVLGVSMSRSAAFGAAYGQFFAGLRGAGLNGPFAHFTDISSVGATTSFHGFTWGLLEDSQQTPSSSPKYAAALNYINTTPCWWTLAGVACSH